ncbi:MAG: hypothetical protein J6U23_00140 [Clostridiales bacterium]|nr:hypothetical protein [Clostridiales bacterium]
MSKLKKAVSFVACLLAATIVLGAFGYKSVRAAESTDAYIFTDAPSVQGGKIRNESGTQDIDELAYCLEIMKQGPASSVDYSRSLLSDTNYSDDVKSKLMVVLMDRQGIYDKICELRDNGTKEAGLYWSNSGPNEYVYQNLIWLIVAPEDFLVNKEGPYGYKGVEKRITGRDDYDYTNGDSMWNTVFDPLLKYIEAESSNYPVGKGAGQYDASYYSPNKEVQHLLGRGFVNPTPKGSLRITKTIEGDVSDSDLTELKFTITDSNGKTYGPYTLGKDFTYDSANNIYYKDLEDIDATLTYTVEETDYKVDGTTVTVSYQIGGNESGSGSVANDITLANGQTTTVDFKDSYEEEKTTTTSSSEPSTSTTTTTTSGEGDSSSDDSTTSTPATTSDGTTTTTTTSDSGSEGTTNTSSVETGKDGTETTTTGSSSETPATAVTGTSENTSSDSAKATPTTVPAKSSSGMTNSSAETTATPTPTGSASKTTSSTPDRNETTSSVTKTGESSSHTVAAALVCIFAAGALLVIRSRKFKED